MDGMVYPVYVASTVLASPLAQNRCDGRSRQIKTVRASFREYRSNIRIIYSRRARVPTSGPKISLSS